MATSKRIITTLVFLAACLLYTGQAKAVFKTPYAPADSTAKCLAIKKEGEVKETAYIEDEVKAGTTNGYVFSGPLGEINEEYLLIGGQKVLIRNIEWIKVKKKRDATYTVFKHGT